MDNDKRIQIDENGSKIWNLCSGDSTLIQIMSTVCSYSMHADKSIVDSERGIQYFLRDLSTAGFLSSKSFYGRT
jgi:hypothetical protein